MKERITKVVDKSRVVWENLEAWVRERIQGELYLHGLAMGDFELALRGLLGEGAPLSESSIARLKATWQGEYDAWRQRSLADWESYNPIVVTFISDPSLTCYSR